MFKPAIGIVIVHFGEKRDTLECIKSLYRINSKKHSYAIYLVDNDPKSRISVDEIKGQNIELTRVKVNLGWAAGANIGCKKALADKCDYILLLNNDTVVKSGLFDKLLPYFKQKNVGMVSPTIVYYDKPKIIWCAGGKLNEKFLFSTHPNMNKTIQAVYPDSVEADYGGTCMLVDARVFKKVGYFDERYFLNFEDVEWCFRARRSGFRLLCVRYLLVKHKVSVNAGVKGSNMLSPKSAYFYARNPFIFLRDHKNNLSIVSGLIGQAFIALPYYTLFRTNSFRAICSYAKGYLDGLRYLLTGVLIS